MKKIIPIVILILLINITLNSQNLSKIYQNSFVNLAVEKTYGLNTNWNEIFEKPDLSKTMSIGLHNQMAIAPDGSVFMSSTNQPAILKFDADGNFIKKFGEKSTTEQQFYMPQVKAIIDGKYVCASDGVFRLQFFDLDGKFLKTLGLDFSGVDCKSLGNNKMAIYGIVPWRLNSTKYIIVIKDFKTGEEVEVWSQVAKNERGEFKINLKDGSVMNLSLPAYSSRPKMAVSNEGNLIVASPSTGTVEVYSSKGVKLKTIKPNVEAKNIDQEDIDDFYNLGKKNISRFRTRLEKEKRYSNEEIDDIITQYQLQMENLKNKGFIPDHLPFFSNLIVDSEGNILIFEFTDEKNTNRFKVYSYDTNGHSISTSSFISDEYKLQFSSNTFLFHNNSIYNIVEKKSGGGQLKRLVKFNLEP
jgi:hypothetical protein